MGTENSESKPQPIEQPPESDIDRWMEEYRDRPEELETDEEHLQRVWYATPGPKLRQESQAKPLPKADIEEANEAEATEEKELEQLAARIAKEQIEDSKTAEDEIGLVPQVNESITELPPEAEAAGLTLEQWRSIQNLVENGQINIFGAIQRVAGKERSSAYSYAVNAARKRNKEQEDREVRERDPELPVFANSQEENAFRLEQARLAAEFASRPDKSVTLEEYLASQPDSVAVRYFRIHAGITPPSRYL